MSHLREDGAEVVVAFPEDEDLHPRWDVVATPTDVAISTNNPQLRKLYLDNTAIPSNFSHHILHRILRPIFLKQHNPSHLSTHTVLHKVRSGNAATFMTPAAEGTTIPPLAQNQ